MAKFPKDAPKKRVVKALKSLGFNVVGEREHIAMERENDDGTVTPLTNAEPPADQRVNVALNMYAIGDRARGFLESIPTKLT